MNRFQIFILLLLIVCIFSSCEKDDLCVPEEAATPRLIIVFVDARNQLLRKPVASLEVIEQEGEISVPLNETGSTMLTQVDSIAIPLRVDQSFTNFSFSRTLNGAVNADNINFSYSQGEVYINRACGFRAIYNDLQADRPDEDPLNLWITSVTIGNGVEPVDVTSNNDIHVTIRH